jgi:hypothetical protein
MRYAAARIVNGVAHATERRRDRPETRQLGTRPRGGGDRRVHRVGVCRPTNDVARSPTSLGRVRADRASTSTHRDANYRGSTD